MNEFDSAPEGASTDANTPRVLANSWEVLLARLLLRLCDRVAESDRDQEFVELYNSIKPLAEKALRAPVRQRRTLSPVEVPDGRTS